MKSRFPHRRRDRPRQKSRIQCLFLERFCGERLEQRRVLDASAVPLWAEAPAVPTQTLNLDAGITATAAAQSGDFTYTSSNGAVTITGYTGVGGAVEIPARVSGMPVAIIQTWAFRDKSTLTSVSIPSTTTTVQDGAFYGCGNLVSIVVEATNSSLASRDGLLYDKSFLTLMSCPEGIAGAVAIPSGVTLIRSNAFIQCRRVTSVQLPNSLKAIGDYAFKSCSSLLSVDIPASVTDIGGEAFGFCRSLTSATLRPGLRTIGAAAFIDCSELTSITIPSTVTYIGGRAFKSCINLTSLSIQNGLPSLSDYVFHGCTGLTTITIPASVTSIDWYAFASCTNLTIVNLPMSLTHIGRWVFSSCTKLASISVPSSVTRIDSNAFRYCTSLASVTIPSSVRSIGADAFASCTSLSVITLPDSIDSIGDGAFSYCSKLTRVGLPSTLTTIASKTFQACTDLLHVTIPSRVTTIGSYAFSSCTSLNGVSLPDGLSSIGSYAFSNCSSLTHIPLPQGVTTIGGGAFSNCTSLENIVIPFGLKMIDGAVFSNCFSLVDVTIPTSVTRIGNSAFASCVKLVNILIPNSVTTIDSFAFIDCSSLASVTIPASVTNIEQLTFARCTSLKTVTIHGSQRYIGQAFEYCTSLVSITIPATVTSVGEFTGCVSLSAIYFFGGPPVLAQFQRVLPDSPLATVYRTASASGWLSAYDSRPVRVFQSFEVPAGRTDAVRVETGVDSVLKKGLGVIVLDAATQLTGGTHVEAGELILRNKESLGAGILVVQDGARVALQTGYSKVSIKRLVLATAGTLDLGTSKLTVAANGFAESDIRTKLIAGRNGGWWGGASGITSAFAGGDRAIGYRVVNAALEVAYAAPGDVNLDGVLDILDIGSILSAGKFSTGEAANWQQGDTNYDGVFDILDLSDILGTGLFNEGTYLTQASASSAAVEMGNVATFDPALVFAALAAEPTSQPTTKRKIF